MYMLNVFYVYAKGMLIIFSVYAGVYVERLFQTSSTYITFALYILDTLYTLNIL